MQQRHFFAQDDARYPKIPPRFTVELLPGEETLGGKVTDEEGRPIAGVKVKIWGYLGEKKEKSELAYMVDATTDERGQWRCRCFRSMKFANLYLSHPDYLSDDQFHPRRHGRPSGPPQRDDLPMEALRDFSDVQVMTKGVEILGKVVDEKGRAVQGAEVGWLRVDRHETFHSDMPTTTTDAEGGFRFPHVEPRPLVLQVKARGHAPELKAVEAKPGPSPSSSSLDLLGPSPAGSWTRRGSRSPRRSSTSTPGVATGRSACSSRPTPRGDSAGRMRRPIRSSSPPVEPASTCVFQQRVPPDEGEVLLTLKRVALDLGSGS